MSDSVNRAFDQLQQEFYHAWFRFHPEEAASVGLEEYAGLLRTYDGDDIGALISLIHSMHSALDEIDEDELDEDRYIDYQLMKSAVSVECHDLQELDWRYRNPLAYVPVSAVYQLLIHPVPDVQKTKWRVPRPAPKIHSAKAQALASFMRVASPPKVATSRSPMASPCQLDGRLGGQVITPCSRSSGPPQEMPNRTGRESFARRDWMPDSSSA